MSSHQDPFLQSMTFAQQGCDCDECYVLPSTIERALVVHRDKRPRIVEQTRHLVLRHTNGTAVWDWTLPAGATEPLTEFGTRARLVWVLKLPENGKLWSIGNQGIIGSQAEQESRKELDWVEGSIYVVPSNGGKAVGWVSPDTAAILRMIKLGNAEDVEEDDGVFVEDEEPEPEPWYAIVDGILNEALSRKNTVLPSDKAEELKEALAQAS